MFSNDIHASDLYFSNPTDHFLHQDREIKTSFESGFSSSYNQTGRSKELQYRNSQDLFSSERTESPFMVCNSDYQKYITQNLLIGSGETSKKSITPFKGKDDERNEKLLQAPQNNFQENQMKDIGKALEMLSGNVRELATEVKLQRKNVLEEVSNLKERISFIEKTIGQKIEIMDENCKILIKLKRNEETMNKQFNDKISKTYENLSDIQNKLDRFSDETDKGIHEIIKIFRTYEAINKKQLLQIHKMCSQTDSTVESVNISLKSSFKDIKNIFDQKLTSLKNYMNNLVIQSGSSFDISERKSSIHGEAQILKRRICNEQEDINENINFKKPVMTQSSDFNSKYPSNAMRSKNSKTDSNKQLTHTPLACYIGNMKSNKVQMHVNKSKTNFSEFENKMCSTNLKLKRKISPPQSNYDSPFYKKPIQKSRNSYCTPLAKTIAQNNTNKFKTYIQRKQPSFFTSSFDSSLNKTESSPVITVYQANTLAKGYVFQRQIMKM